jgi:hypothetical protein
MLRKIQTEKEVLKGWRGVGRDIERLLAIFLSSAGEQFATT